MIDTQKMADELMRDFHIQIMRQSRERGLFYGKAMTADVKDWLDNYFRLNPLPRSQQEIDGRHDQLLRKVWQNSVGGKLLLKTWDFPAGTKEKHAEEAIHMCWKLGTMYERWPLEEYP